jgi:tryptophan halogenase
VRPAAVQRFNEQSVREWEHVRDFIILHYKLTERDDTPFWRRCREMEVPDSLAARIALFREGAQAYQGGEDLFRVDSWVSVMLGQRLEPQHWHHVSALLQPGELRSALDDLRRRIRARAAAMPSHAAYLADTCPAIV